MKNRNFIKNSIALLLPISIGIGVLFGTQNQDVANVDAYTGASLPTTIKLNDPSESTIRNYYSSLNNLSASERDGNNLLKNLKTILSDGQKYYNYDSGDLVWKMYEITDRDWEMSPASSTTYGTYNSSTNTITNYVYGSNSNNKNNPYIRAYYMDRSQTNVVRAWGNHNQDGTGINREHLWAKAEGFDGDGASGARGDPMHLVAANGYANNIHSNHFYGYVDKTKSYVDVKDNFSTLGHNLSGKSRTYPSSNVEVFEPQDCDKGDIARAIFYMAARYNNFAGKTASQETFDADNPNLLLTNDLSKWKSAGYTSSASSPGYHGLISDLLEWNRIDKPDAYEIHRNNLLYTNFTNNRNPFIDFPDWADIIWGDAVGSANPQTDTLNGGASQVHATSIEITTKPTKLVYTVGDQLDTSGMVVVANMSNGTINTLTSSQYTVSPSAALKITDTEAIVTYQGLTASFVIAVQGSGDVTTDETYSITCSDYATPSFTTTDEKFTLSAAANGGTNPAYNSNGYDLRLYANNKIVITSSVGNMTSIVFNISNQGKKRQAPIACSSGEMSYNISATNPQVTWTGNSNSVTFTVGKIAEYGTENTNAGQFDFLSLTINYTATGEQNVNVESITLNHDSLTMEIGESELLIPSILPENATVKLVAWSSTNSSVAEIDSDGKVVAKSAGNAVISCSALDDSEVSVTCSITVNAPITLASLSLSGSYATEYYIGDEFSSNGLVVTAHYSDNTQIDVTDEAVFSGYDMETAGEQSVRVSYGDVYTSYLINVKEKQLAENEIMFIASQQNVGNSEPLTNYESSIAILMFEKNAGTQPKYYSATQSFRVYAKNSFKVVASKKIEKIEFEMSSTDFEGSNVISANVGSLNNGIWTGSSNVVTFTVSGTSGQRNIVSIKITYNMDSEVIKILSNITLSGNCKTEYYSGDSFTTDGLIVTAHYYDGSSNIVTPSSISSPTMSTAGEKDVTISYDENGITATSTYQINVVAVVATSLTLSGNYKTTFIQGEEYDSSGMLLTEHFNNGTTKNHYTSSASCEIEGYDMNVLGEQEVTVSWGSVSTTYTINVIARPYAMIPEEVETGWYLVNDVLDLEAGGIYTIASVAKNKVALAMGDKTFFQTVSGDTTNMSISDNKLIPGKNVSPVELTLGGVEGAWTLHDGVDYVGTSAARALKHDGTTTWTISFDEDNALITSTNKSYGSIQYNSANPRFCNYASNQGEVSLFRYCSGLMNKKHFASTNLTKVIITAQETLDSECSAKSVTTKSWNKIKNSITPFLSTSDSEDYKVLMYGLSKSSQRGGNILEDFLARYDLITSTYGYEQFITDGVNTRSGELRKSSILNINDNSNLAITLIMISCGVVAIGSYIFLKKKRVEF